MAGYVDREVVDRPENAGGPRHARLRLTGGGAVSYQLVRRGLAVPAVALLVGPQVHGLANVPATGPAILAGNHLSMLDPVLLAAAVPRTITFITRSEYFTRTGPRGRFVAGFFRSIGQLPVDRRGGEAGTAQLGVAQQILEDGGLFGIYPEGSRSPDGLVHRGHTGVARLALATGAPVLPVAVTGTNGVFAGRRLIPRRRSREPAVLRIGPALDLTAFRGREIDAVVLRAVTAVVMSALAEMTGLPVSDTDSVLLRHPHPPGVAERPVDSTP